MPGIAICENGGDRKCGDCVAGWKASLPAEKAALGVREGVRESGASRDPGGAKAPDCTLHDGHEEFRIQHRFARQQRSMLIVGVVTNKRDRVETQGHDGHANPGIRAAEYLVKGVKAGGGPEV